MTPSLHLQGDGQLVAAGHLHNNTNQAEQRAPCSESWSLQHLPTRLWFPRSQYMVYGVLLQHLIKAGHHVHMSWGRRQLARHPA
jgi:hypothetical protein